jgi:hypothetical protein
MKGIDTQLEYDTLLIGVSKEKLEKRLEKILDIRKFEIDLYWKRATYFWAFLIAAFTAYGITVSSFSQNANKNDLLKFRFAIICFGFLLSIAFFLVNKASRFWQENWEAHTDYSEQRVLGPLYSLTFPTSSRKSLFNLSDSYSASVSRINIYISFVIIVIWLSLLLDFSQQYLKFARSIASVDVFYTGLLLFSLLSVHFLLFRTISDLGESPSKFVLRERP